MRKHLYVYNWFTDAVVSATVMEDLRKRDTQAEEVMLLTCDGSLGACWMNPAFDQAMCRRCKFWKRGSLEAVDRRIQRISVDEFLRTLKPDEDRWGSYFNYQSLTELRALIFRNVRVGWAALSVYISKTDDVNPKIDQDFRSKVDPLIRASLRLTLVIDHLISLFKPDLISIFNGRTVDTRPVLDLANFYGVQLRGLENVVSAPNRFRVRIFPNVPPQDVDFAREEAIRVWEQSARTLKEKKAIAKQFYVGRRAGKGTRDVRSYIGKQKSGTLPVTWQASRKNIVIFNSSENEIAGVPEVVEGSLFSSQIEGIKFALEALRASDTWVTLRIHPNLSGVKRDYHLDLYKLTDRYPRLTVIEPESEISSYTLMDNSDLVLVFYSTTGVEASYSGKPVIVLGKADYCGLNVGYEPQTLAEVKAFLNSPSLPPKPRLGSEIWAYRIMAQEEYSAAVELRPRFFRIFGKEIFWAHDHMTLLGSKILFRIVSYFGFILPQRLRSVKKL